MSGGIDYNALAAALLRAGLGANVGVNANDTKSVPAGPLVGSNDKSGLEAVESTGAEVNGRFSGEAESWADAVEDSLDEERVASGASESDGSLEFVGGMVPVRDDVRNKVKFGGMSDSFPSSEVKISATSGYYKTVVRNSRAVELRAFVQGIVGVKLPKVAHEDLAVCTYAAGCMPDAVVNGKARLRSLAAVGDAAITLHLVTNSWAKGRAVESAQRERTSRTSNMAMVTLMNKTAMVKFIAFPSGVDPRSSVASATAFEAIVGVLVLYRSPDVVQRFLCGTGMLEQ